MIKLFTVLGVIGAALGLLLGYLGAWLPLFDTASNFRMHIGFGLLIGLPFVFLVSQRWIFFIALVTCLLAIWGSSAAFTVLGKNTTGSSASNYRLIAFNMRFDNPLRQQVPAALLTRDPDILYLTEYSFRWKAQMDLLKTHFPYFQFCSEWRGRGGSYVFSKFPILENGRYCQAYAALMVSPLTIDGMRVDIGGAHFRWPWPASGPKQISMAKPTLERLAGNALVVGDFNTVPWSHSMQRIAEYGNLSIHPGIGPTWLFSIFPDALRQWFGLPIDNALNKGALVIRKTLRLPPMGSDHYPVEIWFAIEN